MHYSPLRYPGGKSKLYSYFDTLIEEYSLENYTYVEPFTGGGGLALKLLFNNRVKNIILNDLDRSIYAFWYSVLNHCDELCFLIEKTNVTMDEREKQKKVQKNKEQTDLLELGFSTFFLNRTNVSGIINAGAIGGNDQNGRYNIQSRYNKKSLIDKIQKINGKKNKIALYQLDASKLIEETKHIKTSLFYFDPPYVEQGKNLYLNFFNEKDHEALSRAISELSRHWVVTYDNVPLIKKLYTNFYQNIINIRYSAHHHNEAKELIISNNPLI